MYKNVFTTCIAVTICEVLIHYFNTCFTYWDTFQENIDNIRSLYNPKILLFGDLNVDLNTRKAWQTFFRICRKY